MCVLFFPLSTDIFFLPSDQSQYQKEWQFDIRGGPLPDYGTLIWIYILFPEVFSVASMFRVETAYMLRYLNVYRIV